MSTEGPKLTEENLILKKQKPIDERDKEPDTDSVTSEGSKDSETSGKNSSIFGNIGNIGSLFGSKKPSPQSLPSIMDYRIQKENATSLAQLLNIIVKENKNEEKQKETVTKEINDAKKNALEQLQAIKDLIDKLQTVKIVEPKDIKKIAGQDYWYKMREDIDKNVKFTQDEDKMGERLTVSDLRKNFSRYLAYKFNLTGLEEGNNEPLTYNKLMNDWKTLREQAEYEDIKKAYEVLNDEEIIKRIIQTEEEVYGPKTAGVENGIFAGKGFEPTTNNFSEVYLVDGGIFKNDLGTEFIPFIVKDNDKDKLQIDKKGLIVFYDLKSKIDKLYWEGVGARASEFAGEAQYQIEKAREFWFDNKGSKGVKEVKGIFLKELLKRAKKDVVYQGTLAKVGNEEEQLKRIKQAILHLMYHRYAPFDKLTSADDPLVFLENKIGITNRNENVDVNKCETTIKTLLDTEKEETFYNPILEEARKELNFFEKANYGMGVLGGKKKTIKKRTKRKGTRRR